MSGFQEAERRVRELLVGESADEYELDLAGLGLAELPGSLLELSVAAYLNLSNNNLTALLCEERAQAYSAASSRPRGL